MLLHLSDRGRVLHQRAAHRVQAEQTRLLEAIDDHGELATALSFLTAALGGKPSIRAGRKAERASSA
ncbi:hypothetical protein ACFYRY_11305 [Streptomyces sp. NPDC005263]|uniref:hypothetical protein n=1 Tax=Streptomyces sp. NPDC005263 TaxID=3364711 RepID=UPI003694908C